MLIAQITDLHYLRAGTRLFGYVDAHSFAEQAVARLIAGPERPDAVLVTGDLTNDGDAEDYQALADILRTLPCPVLVMPGNHDKRALMCDAFGLTPLPGTDKVAQTADGPVRLISLDSLVDEHHHGEIGPEQLAWLDKTLADAPDTPTLIAFHHPPFKTGIGFMDPTSLADAEALAAVLARYSNIEAVLCGHIHRTIVKRFAGTVAMTAPGTAHQVVLDFKTGQAPRWIMEPPGFMLHRWTSEEGLVSHVVQLGEHGAEAPFHNRHTQVDWKPVS